MTVPTFKLSDGTTIPALNSGAGHPNDKTPGISSLLIKEGVRALDTAQAYLTETGTGDGVRLAEKEHGVPSSEVYITTKVSTEEGDPTKPGIALEDLRQTVLDRISNLGFQPNLLLIHNPFVPPKGKLVEFWKILEDMKDKGELTASLGVSNFRPQDFDELLPHCKHKPVINQIEYHPYVLEHLKPNLDIMKEHDILIQAYRPLTPLLRHPTGGPIKPILEKIAARLSSETGREVDAAMAQLLWIRTKGVISVTASSNEERIKKLALTQELRDLTEDEVDEIDAAGRRTEHMTVDFSSPDLPEDV
ncbi:hypothetical protein Rhopal_004279-T1 [Rhodotorula paludigena]|uniref:NADP-dependent oxidoreductase domain-containing protein n=1 Tax=Rhodotorula paludigena TaxID=86838 RepID=A0AAV5GP13_9BASI|nr:hypothetical protein Rhopal_004279-T1 [Rhodotorula paludigena]